MNRFHLALVDLTGISGNADSEFKQANIGRKTVTDLTVAILMCQRKLKI